jgi:hypothetical protein
VQLGGALMGGDGCIFLKAGMKATALDMVGSFPPIAKIRLYGEGGGGVHYTSALAIVDEADYAEMAKRREAELLEDLKRQRAAGD